jgi:uncharacterized protein
MRLRFPIFVYELRKKDKIILYHSLFMKIFCFNLSAAPLLSKLREGLEEEEIKDKTLLKRLLDAGFLVRNESEENELIKIARDFVVKSQRISSMCLIVTNDCNFRCRYCFLHRPGNYMSEETCRKAIDYLLRISSPKLRQVLLYGGEPLLNWDVCKSAIKHIKENDNRAIIGISTNGSLINEEIANFLAENNVRVSLSIDGPGKVHNLMRKDLKGKGTFKLAMRGYKLLKKADADVGVSCTVSTHNINTLPKITEWIITKLEASAIGFNLLVIKKSSPLHVDPNLLVTQIIKCFEICKKYGIFEDRIMRKIVGNWIKGRVYPKLCPAIGGDQIAITPKGEIGPCHVFSETGKYFKRKWDIKRDINFKKFSALFPLNRKECYNCEALGICPGGCPRRSYLNCGSIYELDEDNCIFMKKLLNWMIEEVVKKVNLESEISS